MILIPGEELVNIFLQSYSNSLLDLFFLILTSFGGELGIILLLMIIWTSEKPISYPLTAVMLFSGVLNWFVKSFFALPRPYLEFSNQINLIGSETPSYGFPSGHSQSVAIFWTYLTFWFKNKWLVLLTIILIILVSLSRVYLGIHYLSDVVVGIFFGLIIVAGYFLLADRFREYWNRFTFQQQAFLVLFVPLLLFFGAYILFPSAFLEGKDPGLCCGLLFGGLVGLFAEQRYIKMKSEGVETRAKILRIILGITICSISFLALSFFFAVIPITDGFSFVFIRFIGYSFFAIIAIVVCPLIFVNLEAQVFGEVNKD
ncbi:MAG: phosphatase PAP2 family protein [Candidatus Hermodarchaeota archaeon]